jgi:predicted nuclease of predicted toxin-antitoxin system
MRFLVDMNLSPELADWLRTEGHDALHVVDAGAAAVTDQQIMTRAATEGRVVVSFDLDFGDIAGAVRSSATGVVLLRLRLAGRKHLRRRLQIAIAQAGEAMENGAVVLVEDSRIRIRRRPPKRG